MASERPKQTWQVIWSDTDSVKIESPNWMEALSTALKQRGQSSDFSYGTQFNIDPDGSVTVMDPSTRQTLKVLPDSAMAALEGPGGIQRRSSSQPSAPPPVSTTHAETLYSKDLDPGPGIPLTYRERAIFVGDASLAAAETQVRKLIEEIKIALATHPKGQLVRVAAFDHRWTKQPQKAPMISLEWKDWDDNVRPSKPPASQDTRRSSIPPRVKAESQERLGLAFDALDDMHSLEDPGLALGVALNALKKTIPAECMYAFVYDINLNALKCVQAIEPYETGRLYKTSTVDQGFVGLTLKTMVAHPIMIVNHVLDDSRFVRELDAPGIHNVRDMMVISIGRDAFVFGAIQLINRSGQEGFSEGDRSVATYIRSQLSEFMTQHRHSMPPG